MHARRLNAGLLASLLVLGAGCNGQHNGPVTGRQRASQQVDSSDVYKVVCFFPPNMWQSFDAGGDKNPEGFAFVMYLLSRKTGLGAFADGTFRARMFRVDRSGDTIDRTLAYEWTAVTAELPRRTPSKLGFSYQPYLCWGDLDVYGQEIEIVVQYETPTGKVIQSQTRTTRVPSRKS